LVSGSTYTDQETLVDGYGRISRTAIANGQASNPWYQQDFCYGADGQLSFESYPYQGTGFAGAQVCSGAGETYSYDALGRLTEVAHSDGKHILYNYDGNATQVIDENGVTRITQIDGHGRVTGVCELSSSTLEGVAPAS
jgi:hypothetical protein